LLLLRALRSDAPVRPPARPERSRRPRRPPRSGRLRWLVWSAPLAVAWLTIALLARGGVFERAAPGPDPRLHGDTAPVEVRAGVAGALEARLVPYPADPRRAAYEREGLARRLGLEGTAELRELRLVWAAGAEGALALGDVAVRDAAGVALALPPPGDGSGEAPVDPLRALLASRPDRLAPGESAALVLAGRAPRDGAVLVLPTAGLELALAPLTLPLAEVEGPLVRRPASAPATYGSDRAAGGAAPGEAPATAGSAADARERRIAELERALADEQEARRRRELEWIRYQRLLATLAPGALVPRFEPEGVEEGSRADGEGAGEGAGEATEEALPAEDPRIARAEDVELALRTLLVLEEVRGIDLLDAGELGPEDEHWIGPVVFRLLDDRGRLAGSLSAERLHIEASRAARTLSIVLTDGAEGHGGVREPFDERRISLPFVDPEPWIERVPELFPLGSGRAVGDDGLWPLEDVRRDLNRLFGLDVATGWYRLKSFGGVAGEDFLDVQLEAFDASGRLERRYFADRMHVRAEPPGVVVELVGGAVVRGDQKTPFLQGSYRIYLPTAPLDAWRTARIPGLSSPPRADSPPGAADPEDDSEASSAESSGSDGVR